MVWVLSEDSTDVGFKLTSMGQSGMLTLSAHALPVVLSHCSTGVGGAGCFDCQMKKTTRTMTASLFEEVRMPDQEARGGR
jgi:hypothetical protein